MASYAVIRNGAYTRSEIRGINDHNERRKESYRNLDIDPQRSFLNIHFKAPDANYTEVLDRLTTSGTVSLRGLKGDAVLFNEFLLDVNSRYFEDCGGYRFAKNFYEDAYHFCCEEVGEENILSAVMHADERNRAMSEELGYDVYHYHMHVVYLPVVKKEVLYSKRCKDPMLVGTVKEVINQISHSKRWKSEPVLGEDGKPLRDEKGKAILAPSYSALQTRFATYMQTHGYADIERGIAGKKAKHRSIVDYKLEQDAARAKSAVAKVEQLETYSAQLTADISTQENVLTNLKDMADYVDEVTNCRSILQHIYNTITEFFSQSNRLRNKQKEKEFFELLRAGLTSFFVHLRNLLGFELITEMPLEQCQSPRLAGEGEKLALSLQIESAEQRVDTTANTPKRKDYER